MFSLRAYSYVDDILHCSDTGVAPSIPFQVSLSNPLHLGTKLKGSLQRKPLLYVK